MNLLDAVARGERHRVRALLDGGVDLEQVDDKGRTALMIGAGLGHADIVLDLLDRGAAVDHTDHEGITALYLAASCSVLSGSPAPPESRHKGHDEVVRLLLAHLADTEPYPIGGLQPVSAAARNGNVAATLDLLEAGARFLSDEVVGPNLLCSLAEKGDIDGVRMLLDRGAEYFDIDDVRGAGERTALSCAASARQYIVAKELLDRGAIVRDTDQPLFDAWLQWLEAEAENAYDLMYNGASAAAHYSNAKEYLTDAISLCHRIGRAETAARLEARRDHIKNVFRSQFG